MQDRFRDMREASPLNTRFRRGVAITGTALFVAAPFLAPAPAAAALNSEPVVVTEEDGDDSIEIGSQVADALIVSEDGGDDPFLKIALGGASLQSRCRVQISVIARQWRINPDHKGRINNQDGTPKYNSPVAGDPQKPGDNTRPWDNQRYTVTGFIDQNRTLAGTSDRTREGYALFSNVSPDKEPGSTVEFSGRSDAQNRMPLTVRRAGGLARRILAPCGNLITYINRMRVPNFSDNKV